jgi:ubiquitin-protein ligase
MVNKTKKLKEEIQEDIQEDYPMVPPEVHFLSDRYMVKLPLGDPHFSNAWDLRVHVAKVLESHLGDAVELTSMKVKKPHLLRKSVAKIRRQELYARAYVTVKF